MQNNGTICDTVYVVSDETLGMDDYRKTGSYESNSVLHATLKWLRMGA